MWLPPPLEARIGAAKPPTMPKMASHIASCSTASRQVKTVSTSSSAKAMPPGISWYRRKAPKVTSISTASAAPWTGRLMVGRLRRIRQPQASRAMSASTMPARRNLIGTLTRAAVYLSRKLTPMNRISKPSLATRLPPNSQALAASSHLGGWLGCSAGRGGGAIVGAAGASAAVLVCAAAAALAAALAASSAVALADAAGCAVRAARTASAGAGLSTMSWCVGVIGVACGAAGGDTDDFAAQLCA